MLGIIGGMGPFASELFYRMITEKTAAEKDQDHIELLLLSDAGMPDRTGAILSGNTQEVRDRMLADARLLERSGCRAVAITCNTAHYFADMIAPELSIPIIHMIRETAKTAAARCGGRKVAILATDGTIRTELYQKALRQEGAEPFTPSPENQKLVMYLIYDCVKSGRPADMDAWRRIEDELLSAGCGTALLACTELSCIKADEHLSDFYIDPMEVLAERCIEFMGKQVKRHGTRSGDR